MSRLRRGTIIESQRPAPTRARWCVLLAGFLVLWANPAPAIDLFSSSSLYAEGFFINESDPPQVLNSPGTRQLHGFGSVSSEIEFAQPLIGSGPFVYSARSAISMDPVTGFSFSGDASVSFNDANLGALNARAHTESGFQDQVVISNPLHNGEHAVLLIPFHVTGAASATGSDANPGFNHIAQLTYLLAFDSCSICVRGQIGLTTPGETLGAPMVFDQIVIAQIPFTFGQQFELDGSFAVDAILQMPFDLNAGPQGGSVEGNFGHTVTFGAASVVDAEGHPIPGSVVLSDFDYLAGPAVGPVPEPSSLVLLGLGLLGIGWRATRRR